MKAGRAGKTAELEAIVDLLIDRAPKLRSAGVVRLAWGPVQVELRLPTLDELTGPLPERKQADKEAELDALMNARAALNDPRTYGRTDGRVPTLNILASRRRHDDEEDPDAYEADAE